MKEAKADATPQTEVHDNAVIFGTEYYSHQSDYDGAGGTIEAEGGGNATIAGCDSSTTREEVEEMYRAYFSDHSDICEEALPEEDIITLTSGTLNISAGGERATLNVYVRGNVEINITRSPNASGAINLVEEGGPFFR